MTHSQHSHCGSECRFRLLYEGSQSSLADQAANGAAQAKRVARLREGLVLILRATAPKRFTELERYMGCRLSALDDETILSCAQWLMEPARDEIALSALRVELSKAGFTWASDTTPDALLRAVRQGATPVAPATPSAQHQPGKRTLAEVLNAAAQRTKAESDVTAPRPPAAPLTIPPATDASLTGLFDEGPSEAATEAAHEAATELSSILQPEPVEPVEAADDSTAPAVEHDEQKASEPAVDDRHDAVDLMADIAHNPFEDDEPVRESFDVTVDEAHIDDMEFAPLEEPAIEPAVEPVSEPVKKPAPAPVQQELPNVRTHQPFRPTFSTTPKRQPTLPRGSKERKVKAATPSNTPVEAGSDIDSKFLALVGMSRPIFEADLADQIGSAHVTEEWINAQRSNEDHDVKFIPAKARHGKRGSLIIPVGDLRNAMPDTKNSWWFHTLENYSGAKLYELAVLFHAKGADVVSWNFSDDGSVLSLKAKRGRALEGMVVSLSDDFEEGSTARNSFVDAVEHMIGERLDITAVLGVNDPAMADIQEVVRKEQEKRGWRPNTSVVAARSWEWASGNMGAVTQLL